MPIRVKCFICYSDSDTAGLKSIEENSYILPGLLNLPKLLSQECVSNLHYCTACSRQLTELSELLFELDDLQTRILIGKNLIECKLKESWRKSNGELGKKDPNHILRGKIVKELRSASLMSMLTDKISKHQSAFKKSFCNSNTGFHSVLDRRGNQASVNPLLLESTAQARMCGTRNVRLTNDANQRGLLEEPVVSQNLRRPCGPVDLAFAPPNQFGGNLGLNPNDLYSSVIQPGLPCSLITPGSINDDAQAESDEGLLHQFGAPHIKIEYLHEDMEEAVPLALRSIYPDPDGGHTETIGTPSLEVRTNSEHSSRTRRAQPTRRSRKHGKGKPQPSKPSKPICQECGKWFASPLNLRDHVMKQHRGLANFHCHLCGFGLLRQSHLKAHLLSKHTKERNFKCNYCPASYKNQRVLTIHLRKHTGEKPYECVICNERFTDSTFLRRHEKSRHGQGCEGPRRVL